MRTHQSVLHLEERSVRLCLLRPRQEAFPCNRGEILVKIAWLMDFGRLRSRLTEKGIITL
jgi:hypothetical protein